MAEEMEQTIRPLSEVQDPSRAPQCERSGAFVESQSMSQRETRSSAGGESTSLEMLGSKSFQRREAYHTYRAFPILLCFP